MFADGVCVPEINAWHSSAYETSLGNEQQCTPTRQKSDFFVLTDLGKHVFHVESHGGGACMGLVDPTDLIDLMEWFDGTPKNE